MTTRFAFFGAAPDTGNLGVSALCFSVLGALSDRDMTNVTVFDYGRGAGPLKGWGPGIVRAGAMRTNRWYRRESHAAIGCSLAMGFDLGPSAAAIRHASAFLDISGGDSFTSLYGSERFKSVCWSKRLALRLGKPLVLLPQTFGPFDRRSKPEATRLVRGAAMCWARDERSFVILRDLLGDGFDSARHRCGVDVAFLLEKREPKEQPVDRALNDGPLAALNISGLIYNDPDKAATRYRFRADYREAMRFFVQRLVASGARALLVPHVVTPRGHYESDTSAAEALVASLPASQCERVTIAPEFSDPREVKWLISKSDWFCGTRMHATIAALSSGVPTAAVAYSDKTLGVFETCGQGGEVVDPRRCDTDEVVEHLWDSYTRRDAVRGSLARHLPAVLSRANEQMDVIAALCGRVAGLQPQLAGCATRVDGGLP